MRHATRALSGLALVVQISACAPVIHGAAFSLGPVFPARAPDCELVMFRGIPPTALFDAIARVTVRAQATGLVITDFETAAPELRRQACAVGADALYDFSEERGGHVEMRSYRIEAIAIKLKR